MARSTGLAPEVVRAIEQLHYREKWDEERIASMFGIKVETVVAAAKLRTNFEVVWHEALHFVQHPGEDLFSGEVQISLHVPQYSRKQKVVKKQEGKIAKEALLSDGMCDS